MRYGTASLVAFGMSSGREALSVVLIDLDLISSLGYAISVFVIEASQNPVKSYLLAM